MSEIIPYFDNLQMKFSELKQLKLCPNTLFCNKSLKKLLRERKRETLSKNNNEKTQN